MNKKYIISKSKMYNRCIYYLNNYSANSYKLKEIMQKQIDKYFQQYKDDAPPITLEQVNIWMGEVIKSLKEYGYVDDYKYALYLAKKHEKKGKSIFLIKQEMSVKGVSKEYIDKVFTENIDDFETEEEKITNYAIKKKIGVYFEGDVDEKIYRKHFSHLQRKGYSIDLIKKVVKR